mmetsp:Transcript_23255/g.61356  ORF Transcript_23255/g.61356 Transcript_23255/m.61356 type:complete len:202 (+) Transcript_23255:597-1202(+)
MLIKRSPQTCYEAAPHPALDSQRHDRARTSCLAPPQPQPCRSLALHLSPDAPRITHRLSQGHKRCGAIQNSLRIHEERPRACACPPAAPPCLPIERPGPCPNAPRAPPPFPVPRSSAQRVATAPLLGGRRRGCLSPCSWRRPWRIRELSRDAPAPCHARRPPSRRASDPPRPGGKLSRRVAAGHDVLSCHSRRSESAPVAR